MAFCRNCGNQLSEGAVFCNACGTPVNAQAQQPQQPQQAQQAQQTQQNPYQAQQNPYQQRPVDPRTLTGDADVQANKGMAWLSYFGILLLIPMFARKESEYCRYHVKQGATLLACDIVYTVITQILLVIIRAIFPAKLKYAFYTYYYEPSAVTTVFTIIFGLASLFFLVLAIIGIVNAVQGKKQELPLIGKIPFIADLLDNTLYKNYK